MPAVSRGEGAPTRADTKTMSGLVSQLGSRLFKEREDAAQQLRGLGVGALDALRSAARSTDPEIRRRAETLSSAIQHQLETERILQPKLVRLRWDKIPVSEAIADFSKKTGLVIECQPSAPEKRISLDTGEVTVWQALEKFCDQAGLVERAAPAQDVSSVQVINRPNGQIRIVSTGTIGFGQTDIVRLEAGSGSLPTCHAGSVRIRSLPIDDNGPWLQQRRPGERLALLEVSPQPKMGWQTVLDVQVERAIDENDQSLALAFDVEAAKAAVLGRFPRQRIAVMQNGTQWTVDPRLMPVHFTHAERPSHVLKELSGKVSALVLSPLQSIFTVANVLQAQGRSFTGNHGEVLKIATAAKSDDASFRLGLEVTDAALTLNPPMRVPRRFVQANGMVMNRGGFQRWGQGEEQQVLKLFDNQGRTLDMTGSQTSMSVNANGVVTLLFDLHYQAGDDVGEPTKFLFSARRYLTIEIPFKLKDVPIR